MLGKLMLSQLFLLCLFRCTRLRKFFCACIIPLCVEFGQIAVDQGFGGIDSKQKALWLIDVVVDFFRDNGF